MKIAIVILFTAMCVSAQTILDTTQVPFTSVDRIGEANARAFFVFQTSLRSYAIRHDGHAEASQISIRRQNFELKMGGPARLERVYFAEFEGDLMLEYEVRDQRGSWGYITRMDQKKLVPKWTATINGDTLGPGLIDQHELYISGANLFAKLDVQNGSYLWKQDGLEQFFSFSVPSIKGDAVVFRDDSERTIEVDKQTGRVIKH